MASCQDPEWWSFDQAELLAGLNPGEEASYHSVAVKCYTKFDLACRSCQEGTWTTPKAVLSYHKKHGWRIITKQGAPRYMCQDSIICLRATLCKNEFRDDEPPLEGAFPSSSAGAVLCCDIVPGWLVQDWDNDWVRCTLILDPEDGPKQAEVEEVLELILQGLLFHARCSVL